MSQNKMAKALRLSPLVSRIKHRVTRHGSGKTMRNARIADPSTPEMGEEDA